MKYLETVLKAINIDLDLNMWCDDCQYKFRINCKENLRDDLLLNVKELREENDRLSKYVEELEQNK